MDIEGEIDNNTVIIGDFNIPLPSLDKSSREKINKETMPLKDILNQMDLIDMFKTTYKFKIKGEKQS